MLFFLLHKTQLHHCDYIEHTEYRASLEDFVVGLLPLAGHDLRNWLFSKDSYICKNMPRSLIDKKVRVISGHIKDPGISGLTTLIWFSLYGDVGTKQMKMLNVEPWEGQSIFCDWMFWCSGKHMEWQHTSGHLKKKISNQDYLVTMKCVTSCHVTIL